MENSVEKVISNWEVFYYISTYILAFVAVVGFISSQKSSEKVSDALKVIQRGLSSLSEPLIKFSGYQWIVGKDGTNIVSRSNPPQGILFSLSNVSNVPIQIVENKFYIYYGDKLLDDPTSPMGSTTSETYILAPNESIQNGTKQPELFERYLGKPKDMTIPPHINIKCDVKFKTMDGDVYTYHIHREIHFNIESTSLNSSKTLRESLEKNS
ncbi:hypothetical protein IFVP203_C1210005 [Vibrio parahaemolyticus]